MIKNVPNHRRDLPNTEGFRFVAVHYDGSAMECRIARRTDGTHYVRGMAFKTIAYWLPIKV